MSKWIPERANMSLALTNNLLQDRAYMLSQARVFFAKRGILEVDVPLLSRSAPIDPYIDVVRATCNGKPAFLHTSPEYGMKRLLCAQSGDIYQLGHVFRDFESGKKHLVEFTIAEWYRIDFSLQEMMEETFAFIQLFVDVQEFEVIPYGEFMEDEMHFALEIEPNLGRDKVTFVSGYPPSKAALARVKDGIAQRFEVFLEGVELGNGYLELQDPLEQKRRLEEANLERLANQKESYPIDREFLAALEEGLPDCCGVAIGFDRLMMLRHNREDIEEVIPFRGIYSNIAPLAKKRKKNYI